MYGGFNPAVTHVYFTHGSLDPWHRMGVLSDLNEHSQSTIIPGNRFILNVFYFDFTVFELSLMIGRYFTLS